MTAQKSTKRPTIYEVAALAGVPLTQVVLGTSGKIGEVFCAIYIAPIVQVSNNALGGGAAVGVLHVPSPAQ